LIDQACPSPSIALHREPYRTAAHNQRTKRTRRTLDRSFRAWTLENTSDCTTTIPFQFLDDSWLPRTAKLHCWTADPTLLYLDYHQLSAGRQLFFLRSACAAIDDCHFLF
jgi:hypothetical protein